MIRILGIDPGSRTTGYGVIDVDGSKLTHVGHGAIQVHLNEDNYSIRLKEIFLELQEVIKKFKPDAVALEKVFFAKNPVSALKLGQARGVAILAAALNELELFEYNPTEIKMAVVGHGRAEKEQVAVLLQKWLKIPTGFDTHDASDGLAVAFCHARLSTSLKISKAKSTTSKTKRKNMSLAEVLSYKLPKS